MSFQPPPGSGNGGAFFPASIKPIWHPPIPAAWIVTVLLLVASVNLNALPPQILQFLTSPYGFFITLMLAILAYDGGSAHTAFALVFMLLIAWSKYQRSEGFSGPAGTVDWVTNTKRWFVEVVLKEKPLGIQERRERTYPIQGYTSNPSS
jgi:hypothetical protein